MDCSICLEHLSVNDLTLKCGHKFHRKCIENITNNLCPLCRTRISNKICTGSHCQYGYSPYVNNGTCRFCYGIPLKVFFKNI